jgi:uncharacterized protein with PQ loop repeat
MEAFLINSREYQAWGYNGLTFGFLATVIFTILQAYGLTMQGKIIWDEGKAESLSGLFFAYSLFYFFTALIYGICSNSLALVLNGLLGFFCLPIVLGIYKFEYSSGLEKICAGLCCLMLPAMYWIEDLNNKDWFFLVLLFGILAFMLLQIKKMYDAKQRGALKLLYLIIFILTAMFWLYYSIEIGNQPIQIFSVLALILYCPIIWMYIKFKPVNAEGVANA